MFIHWKPLKAYGTKDWVKCKALNQLFWYHSATVTGFAYGKIDRNTQGLLKLFQL